MELVLLEIDPGTGVRITVLVVLGEGALDVSALVVLYAEGIE